MRSLYDHGNAVAGALVIVKGHDHYTLSTSVYFSFVATHVEGKVSRGSAEGCRVDRSELPLFSQLPERIPQAVWAVGEGDPPVMTIGMYGYTGVIPNPCEFSEFDWKCLASGFATSPFPVCYVSDLDLGLLREAKGGVYHGHV